MAWLQNVEGNFHISFRFGGQKFKRSLKTKIGTEAHTRKARLEETIRLVESGRMEIPQDADVATFLLSVFLAAACGSPDAPVEGHYTVQRSRDAHAGRTFYLAYQRTLDGLRDRLEIDVNFLHRQSLLASTRQRMWQPADAPECEFPIMSFDELAAGKLIALLDRRAPRDAWDVAHLPKLSGGEWPTARSRAIFIAMAGTLPHALHSYADRGLSQISDADVTRQLHPVLVAGNRPTGDEIRAAALRIVHPLLDLTAEERKYCDRLQVGELSAELLFPDDPKLASRVAVSPPLLWKAENARRHSSRGG